MSTLVKPHGGGKLKPLLLEGDALAAELARAEGLTKISVSSRESGDIIMMGIGGFTPLDGFMTHADWTGVCDGMKMASGLFWPIPITLSTDEVSAKTISDGDDIALVDSESGEILATMTVTEKYGIDKAHECMMVYKTTDAEHPGVKMVMEQGEVNLAGSIKVLSQGGFPEAYGDQFMTPAQSADPRRIRKTWLERDCLLPDTQPDAPFTRVPGKDCHRNPRRCTDPFAARQAQARRYSG